MAGVIRIFGFIQAAAGRTNEHKRRMSRIFSQNVAGEEVEVAAAVAAYALLYPEEIFDIGILPAGKRAARLVERANLSIQMVKKGLSAV